MAAESNYSFHDTYSQFFLLGSNDFTIPKYWLANANLSIAPRGGPWIFTLWGRNIFNKDYDVTRNFFLPNAEVAQSGEPADLRHPVQLCVLTHTRAEAYLKIVGIVLSVLLACARGRRGSNCAVPTFPTQTLRGEVCRRRLALRRFAWRISRSLPRRRGDTSLPLLVLLHGFGDSYTTWDGWVRELGGKFRIIRLDFPGHGLTRAPVDYLLRGDALADFVDAFAAKLDLPQFAVAGNSMAEVSRGSSRCAIPIGSMRWCSSMRPVSQREAARQESRSRSGYSSIRLGRAFLRNIDNRPLIEEGL